jgi:hypothetical protein
MAYVRAKMLQEIGHCVNVFQSSQWSRRDIFSIRKPPQIGCIHRMDKQTGPLHLGPIILASYFDTKAANKEFWHLSSSDPCKIMQWTQKQWTQP